MKTNIITITFLFLMIALTSTAQDEEVADSVRSGFGIHSVNLTASFYQPQMDYWNDTYLPFVGITETFGGNLAFGGNITFSLPANLRVRTGVSVWSGEVIGTPTSKIGGLKIGLTRFNLGLFYAPEAVGFSGFQPYLGVEGQLYQIKNDFTAGDVTNQQGSDISFAPVIGLDRTFGLVNCGLELKYNMGSYVQEVEMNTGIAENDVSINGPEVIVTIGYKF